MYFIHVWDHECHPYEPSPFINQGHIRLTVASLTFMQLQLLLLLQQLLTDPQARVSLCFSVCNLDTAATVSIVRTCIYTDYNWGEHERASH